MAVNDNDSRALGLTFLQRAKAIMVMRFPGTPTIMYTIQAADANISSPGGYPSNSVSDAMMADAAAVDGTDGVQPIYVRE